MPKEIITTKRNKLKLLSANKVNTTVNIVWGKNKKTGEIDMNPIYSLFQLGKPRISKFKNCTILSIALNYGFA